MQSTDKGDRLARLLSAWAAKRRDAALPAHADLRPEDLLFMLPDLCLIGVPPDGGYRFRLVGTGVADRLHHDPTGQGMDTLAPATASALHDLFDATLQGARPMAASGRLAFGDTDRVLDALCVPFADAAGCVSVLLLGLTFRSWRDVDLLPPLGQLAIWSAETEAPAPARPPIARTGGR